MERRLVPCRPWLTSHRVQVLKHIQDVVDKFCKHVGKLKGLPQSTIDTMNGKIFCFGSYALGVHGPCESMPWPLTSTAADAPLLSF